MSCTRKVLSFILLEVWELCALPSSSWGGIVAFSHLNGVFGSPGSVKLWDQNDLLFDDFKRINTIASLLLLITIVLLLFTAIAFVNPRRYCHCHSSQQLLTSLLSEDSSRISRISCRADLYAFCLFSPQVSIDDCGLIKVDKPYAVSTAAVAEDV